MRDIDVGKRMIEASTLDQILPSYVRITGRRLTDLGSDHFEQVEGSPDFVVEFDGCARGFELAEIRDAGDAWSYYEEASRLTTKKHDSYSTRGLFRNPIVLILHSREPPLFDIQHELNRFVAREEFESVGFLEVWSIDLGDMYFTPGDPIRLADMFCFKPCDTFGFYRIGETSRKPYG